VKTGGAEGSRTPDLLIANETLYQLSYDPIHEPANIYNVSGKSQEPIVRVSGKNIKNSP
jgi:hypothetical protein